MHIFMKTFPFMLGHFLLRQLNCLVLKWVFHVLALNKCIISKAKKNN